KPDPTIVNPLLVVAGAIALAELVASRVMPRTVKPRPGTTRERVALTRHIVGCGCSEGGALFACVVFLITRSTIALAIAAISFAGLLLLFPSENRWNELLGPAGGLSVTALQRDGGSGRV